MYAGISRLAFEVGHILKDFNVYYYNDVKNLRNEPFPDALFFHS